MAKQRLINCDFMNDMEASNKAKFLYFMMFVNADDRGFVGNSNEIIGSLQSKSDAKNEISLELLDNDYKSALHELVEKGLLIKFNNNHGNNIYLFVHWYFHNQYKSGLWTNYFKFLQRVELVDKKYILKKKQEEKKPLKENKLNENKLNEIKEKQEELKEETDKTSLLKAILDRNNASSKEELTGDELKEYERIELDLPF